MLTSALDVSDQLPATAALPLVPIEVISVSCPPFQSTNREGLGFRKKITSIVSALW